MSKKDFIKELYVRRSDYKYTEQAENQANSLDTLSNDIYSESQRFIYELIQNADDAASWKENEVHFDFYSDCIVISHNGKPFDEKDIEAITSIGSGTKESDQSKTGYKGIGFKSVFGKSDTVHVFSDGYNFRFDRKFIKQTFNGVKMPWQIIPVWTDKEELPKSARNVTSNGYNVCTVVELKNTNSLINELNELLSNGKILLFLRRIVKISVSVNGQHKFSIEKDTIKKKKYFDKVSILNNQTEISRWIVKVFEKIPIDEEAQTELQQDEKTPDKLKKAKFTDISFAARIEKGRIKALKGEDSLIFTYLPTKVLDFEFPFLVNGNFLTNASREAIHEDRFWNQWLFKNISIKIFDWLELLSTSKYKYQILHLLPGRFNSIQNELKIAFDRALNEVDKIKAFIPNKNGMLRKASEILIDKTGLSDENFISKPSLIEFINKVENKNFDSEAFIHFKVELKWKLNDLGSTTFALDNLEDFFKSQIFQDTHDLNDNPSLIEFLYNQSSNGTSLEWNDKLKKVPFIYAKGEKLKTPETLCFPSIDFQTDFGGSVSVIHRKIYSFIEKNENIKIWIEKLGVKEPSDISYLEKEVLPNLEGLINKENYITITRYIFKLHKRNELNFMHYQKLGGLQLLCKKNSFHNAADCFLSDYYSPKLQIESLYENNNYVNEKYCEHNDNTTEWKLFFIKIGVSESINIITLNRQSEYDLVNVFNCYERFFRENSGPKHYSNWSYHSYSIVKISFVEKANDYNFSKIFWKTLFTSNISPLESLRPSRGYWGFDGGSGAIRGDILESYVEWILSNLKIIPASTQKCYYPNEVFLNKKENLELAGDYLPVFDYNEPIPEAWKEKLPLKETLELDHYLLILKNIGKEFDKKNDITKSNISRIGLIYNKLASEIKDYSKEKKTQIRNWAIQNRLYSETLKFENASELIWIKISGFSTSSKTLKTIFIPDNCNSEAEYFEELLSLLGVQVIDEFIPSFENSVPNASLKIQLQIILPYLVALIEKKQFGNFSTEFERISSIIDKSEFFNVSEIKLSFKNQGKLISGPTLRAYLYESQLYFKSKWTDILTMYFLVPEIAKLLSVKHLNEELKLILQLDENEIKEWFLEQGYDLQDLQEKPEYLKSLEKVKSYTSEEDTEQSYDLVDNSDEKSRISISQDAKESILEKLKQNGFYVPDTLDIHYTVVKGIKNPEGLPVKLVVKSGKAGKLYFNPNEWLALTEPDTQLFVVTRGNIVRNVILDDLIAINDTFHMRFNTQTFAISTNLKAFANFFRYLPYTHFIFDTPESTTDYLQQFGLNERNSSSNELSSDDKNLLH